jgi:hypothetical protein
MTTLEPTVAAPPSTQDVASQLLASMAALSGVLTDYNSGSQIRTIAESIGSVVEMQGAWTQAAAAQALIYGAMGLLGISPYPVMPASGLAQFMTSTLASPPAATQNVFIPSGTIIQTPGGIQFSTTASGTLASGAATVLVPALAAVGGTTGNVPASGITQIVTGLLYPLFVTNPNVFSGGAPAEQFSQTLARFYSTVGAIPAASPYAIANAAIGVTSSGTGEVVRFATCYEPFAFAGSGAGSGTASWTLIIDNGTGSASASLIAAVTTFLNGGISGTGKQYRDAGVPYTISGVIPTYAYVGISGMVSSLSTDATVSGLMAAAVSGYFTLPFGASGSAGLLTTAVGNSVLGLMDSLSVSLYATSGMVTAVNGISPPVSGRVVLGGLTFSLD